MKYDDLYNDQRDNPNWINKFPGSWQCFSTSSWMRLTKEIHQIRDSGDEGLRAFVDDVEAQVGKAGIAEKLLDRIPLVNEFTSLRWDVQQAGIQLWLDNFKIKKKAIYSNKIIPFNNLQNYIIINGPVILRTYKMGGLKGGHVILALGKDRYHDPYGNARTNYEDRDGKNVLYSYEYMEKFAGKKIRCIYLEKN